MKPLPSRLKIALLSAGISGLVLIVFGAFTWFLVYQMRIAAVDREIRTLAARHPGLFANRGNFSRLASSLEFTFGEDYTNRIFLQLRDPAGRVTYFSTPGPDGLVLETPGTGLTHALQAPAATTIQNTNDAAAIEPSRAPRGSAGWGGYGRGFGGQGPPPPVVFTKVPKFFTARAADAAWRIGVLGNNDLTLVIGLNEADVQGELNHVRDAFLITLPVALFVVGLGGWVVAGRALRPLKTIADTAERVTARGLDQRIPESGDSPEAGRVVQVLNRMMDRLETSFRQATRFSADASHELKTPLAVMQGELENALQSAAPGSAEQQLFSNLLEEIQRLKTITRSLLLLAQADTGRLKLALEPVDLSAELGALIEDARVLAADSRLQFDVEIQPQLGVEADRALLHTALFNLIINAIKYNEPNGRVSIRLITAENKTVLTIGNTGPGIPPADEPRIFDRFFRVDRVKSPAVDGIGLGLSLAREIVRAHGGELTLTGSVPGWTGFALTLEPEPKSSPAGG